MATQTERKPSNNCMRLTRNVPTMPDWVTEQSDRVGPKPPSPPTTPNPSNKSAKPPPLLPPKTTNKSPEPDYEIIEFSGQQYSNQPVTRAEMRSKTPDTKPKCTLCGSNNPWVRCDECAHQIFCASCDDMFHRHPKRKNHLRKALEETRPPLPAKTLPGQPRPSPPVPPPRRSKRGNAATPLMPRKDQVRASVKGPVVPSSPTPSDTSRNGIWSERGTDSLIRGMNFSNRPLPDTPKTPTTPSDDLMSSRSTTPRSVFDAIQRPPSVTLEKIKSKASATLDRMTQLQQRYRLQKEERERNRSGSVTDQRHTQNKQPLSQHHHHQSHFPDDRNVHLGQRQTSTSVFNLNQLNRRPTPVEMNENQWPESNQMQQAHSMAHLNWSNNHHRPQASDHWNNQFCTNQQLNRSNLSLNVGAGYLVPPQHPINMYPTPQPPAPPPPVFMNTRGIMPNMYPYPYPGMPFMSPGIVAMPPPPRSRAASRASSRIPSPTLSRKSLSLRNKKRSSFTETEPTDDEDSDQYDRRSLMSNRSGMGDVPRQRRVPQSLLDDSESNHSYNLRTKIREQRHGSFAKPALNQNEWLPERRASTSNVRPNDAGIGLAPLKSSRIYSDLDSEGSAGTRALVQAKIQQKLDKEPIKRRSSRGKDSTIAKQRNGTEVVKKSTEVQAGRVRSTKESTEEDRQKFSDKENIYPNDASTRLKESQERSEESPKDINESVDDESEEEIVKEDKNESPPLGPPPGTPDHEWECEFCTFVNEPKVKICTICCKTPSRAPESNRSKTQSVPVQAKQLAETSTNRATASKQRQATTSKELAVQTKVLPIDRTGKPNEAKTTPKKDSEPFDDDIWATLEENIQAAAGAVILKAESRIQKEASTDRGTPPVHQTRPESDVFAREKTAIQNHKNLTLNSATVPPPGPQNISTQTYETLPVVPQQKQEERNGGFDGILDNRRELENRTPIDQVSSALTSGNNLQFVRDQMLLQMERERYRSSSDLRRIDISPMDYSPVSGLGRRQSSVAELLLLHRGQQQQQQLQSYSPLPGLPLDPGSYHEMKPLRDPETELYLLIKEAELHKFTSEELHIALKFCGNDTHPVQWLRENWFKLVRTVQNLATKYGQERAENTIGTISENEAREALRIHFGNIWQAVSECIEQRQKKFRELSYRGNFSREDIVTALTTYHGNIEASFADLNKTQLSPIVVNIWGSPAGAENESGVEVQNRTSSSAPNVIDANSAEAEDLSQIVNNESIPRGKSVSPSNALKITSSAAASELNHNIAEIESPVRSLKEALGPTAGVNEELSRNESQLLVLDEGEHLLTHSQSINSSKTNTKVNLQVLTKESNQNSGEERNQHPQVVEKILTEVHRNITDSTPQTKIGAHNSPAIQKPSDKIDLHNKGSEEYPTASAQEKTSDTQTNPDLKVSSTTNPAQHLESAAGIIEVALNEPQKEAPTTSKTLIKNSSNFSNPSKIPKPKSSKIQQKIPTRSKSFSIPSPTHIGVSSVKAIKQEYLNQQKPLKKSTETKVLNSATAAKRKNSITAVISKLNQTGAANNGTSLSPTRTGMNGRGFLRSHSQPRIPKKNYHETCFSDDDYESSDATDNEEKTKEKYDEEMNQLDDSSSEMHQRKQSVPVFRAYPVVQEPEAVNPEELARQFLDNKVVSNEAEAQVAATLVSMKFQKDVSLWAAKECTDLQHAIALLQQECELCTGTFALNQMVSMLKCTHKCCKQCAQTYFTVQITDRSINDCNCPFCKVPELHEQNQHEDENLEYFSNLDILLKNILDPPVHELFQRKLRDRTLLQDPNFKWCVQCSSGFFARPKQRRLICPDCGSVTCSQCRKKWEKQHEELSCEKFLAWKEANDPEVQAQGVQQHLAQNGIDCPKCKFRYSLTRGGCMHFTCTQCKFEFCYGCSKPFMMGAKCKKSPYCSKLGLHAHHPRNCLFYLRDKLPMQLQFLLKQNSVNYEVESLPAVTNDGTTNHRSGLCPIQIQKETPKGLVDTVCNVDITDKEAGLCRTHYVEYLSATVAKAGIDPLPIFDLTDCVQELRRRGIPLPERGPWDTDEIYKNMCAEIIKEKIPLNSD